jgi:DnaJ-related protein SCJ1
MPEGHEVVFEGESDESPDWEAGDVILRIRSRKNKGGWRRKESSLYWRETIGVDEVRSPRTLSSLILIFHHCRLY